MNIDKRNKYAIVFAILVNVAYFIFMLYMLAKANKGIYIVSNLKSFSLYVVILSTMCGRIIGLYFEKKYPEQSLLDKATENSFILSVLYIVKIACENMLFIGGFFVFISYLANF
ncbi:hypothetical protein [Moraxella sp. ZY210820]|uniref:hypothetical protein n=1 Tax=unclassified Moraxella TaxID=2685852 RepID=UPI0027312548|nr:hypothetical protein [Moraxella sp. ZY210820]WLF84309.1 hypothetical protein LU301_02080 [Moraxella sp. ZY210820]